MMRLYRGLTVAEADAEIVRQQILREGLTSSPHGWNCQVVDLRPRLAELLDKPDLTTADTRPSRKIHHERGWHLELIGGRDAVCACGDDLGAAYYALKHNRSRDKTAPLLVTFDVDPDQVQVDGCDFLYNFVFQSGKTPGQRAAALALFGDALGRYLDLAWRSDKMEYRVALCDLAVQDPDLVSAHLANQTVIGGRYGTVFRSAFMVPVPVAPAQIVSVTVPEPRSFVPEMTIESFRRL